jgi:hypothetical protein
VVLKKMNYDNWLRINIKNYAKKTIMKTTFKILIIITLFSSCSKDDNTATKKETIVYVAGNQIINSKSVATLWENNKPKTLTNGTNQSLATAVYVANNTTYVVGSESNGGYNVAKIWTNGVGKNIADGTKDTKANAVFVSGNNVYVAGEETDGVNRTNKAKLWINNNEVILNNAGNDSAANTVFVVGNDFYVGGYVTTNGNHIPTIWKNSEAPRSLDIGDYLKGEVKSLNVSEGNVYAVGFVEDNLRLYASLWKNNEAINMSFSNPERQANKNQKRSVTSKSNAVFINGNDIYSVGFRDVTENVPGSQLSKNGNIKYLSDGTKPSEAKSIFVSGNDVYIVGFEADAAIIWKNEQPSNLTITKGATKAVANAVFVSN